MGHPIYKKGNILEISIDESKRVIGLSLGEPYVLLFKGVFEKQETIDLDNILEKEVWFYSAVSIDDSTLGFLKTLKRVNIEEAFLNKLPPQFHQDLIDKNCCKLIYLNGQEEDVKPEKCIGLESAAIWPGKLWLDRIRDEINNVKNVFLEKNRIKL